MILTIITGFSLRIIQLDVRPMHSDEAVNAARFNQLLQDGHFAYNPADYHGPLLFYCAWPLAKLMGKDDWQQLTEKHLRMVTALFGLLLILLPLLLRPFLTDRLLFLMIFFLAFSPPLIFFNRYFIHETIFVFWLYLFFFLLIRAYFNNRHYYYFLSGLSLGMAMGSKETWPLFLTSLLAAFVLVKFLDQKNTLASIRPSWKQILLFFSGVLLTWIALFSDLGRNFNGLWQFVESFKLYFQRGYLQQVHVHPWYQYFEWLFFFRLDSFWWTTELLNGLLLIFGFYGLFKKEATTKNTRQILRLIGFSALFCALLFSLIPYKTPWNVLPFWYGLLLVVAYGFNLFWQRNPKKAPVVLFLLWLYISWQYQMQNFKKETSLQNPYVYAHPTKEVLKLANVVNDFCQQLPDSSQTYLQVIVRQNDYWPLPWYFRNLQKVGYWNTVPFKVPSAPLIIAELSLEDDLRRYLYEKPPPGKRHLYLPYFQHPIHLRPLEPQLQLYIRKDQFDRINQK